MPTLYIHAGLPKTGTTALRAFLYQHRELLSDRFSLYYPATGTLNNDKQGSHTLLIPVQEKIWNHLRKEVSTFPKCDVIISLDRISRNSFKDIVSPYFDIIRQAFQGYDIKIIVYLRRFDDYAKKYYAHMSKNAPSPTPVSSYKDFFEYIIDQCCPVKLPRITD
ncbi:hypothetical protein KL86DPRO_20219 [uncultured delta proteobacterium]|uniref:Sulfotransferase domain-containing protein n=1 Tax=uncultured delta proteobacterium TaxID=34034 RepID=A0A212JX53_9DELT|nr:hypothetical protein KL86DPRO_20219 [uncultured delta proteobacterium]